jgi:exosortase/archaeosortase family protein
MFPMPFLDNVIASPLRLHMAQLLSPRSRLFGVANDQVGTAILSAANPSAGLAQGARFAIDIADPCSGMHSLFALLMIGALYAHLTLDKTWQKWLLFLAAVPLAVLGNITRIVVITFATIWWGSNVAIGTEENPSNSTWAPALPSFLLRLAGWCFAEWPLTSLGRRFHPPAARRPSRSRHPRLKIKMTGSSPC